MVLSMDKLMPDRMYSFPVVDIGSCDMHYLTHLNLSMSISGLDSREELKNLYRCVWASVVSDMKRSGISVIFSSSKCVYDLGFCDRWYLRKLRGVGVESVEMCAYPPLTPFHVSRCISRQVGYADSERSISISAGTRSAWSSYSGWGVGFSNKTLIDVGQVSIVEL